MLPPTDVTMATPVSQALQDADQLPLMVDKHEPLSTVTVPPAEMLTTIPVAVAAVDEETESCILSAFTHLEDIGGIREAR